MNNSVSTDVGGLGLGSDDPEWGSKSSFLDNDGRDDGSMELMLAEQDSEDQDQRSVTKMIPSERGQGKHRESLPFVKQWSYSMHRMPTTREASRLTLKAKAKFQQDLHLRGYRALDCKRKCGLASLFAAFLFCVAGTAIMWCTSVFQDLVTGTMVISNSSNTWDWWKAPPVNPLLMVYIFNYTNADSFGSDGHKLRVKEVGPFTYRETTEKVDFQFFPNSTLSYHEKKSYEFIPEMSNPQTEDVKVFVPNIPFMSAIATVREEGFLKRFAMNTLLRTLESKPILHINVRDLLFGYEDRLFSLAKMAAINGHIPYKKFGLMVPKVGVSEHEVTMHTGAGDMSRLGQIVNFNGQSSQGVWRSDECNRIEGSDGSQFPPPHVSPQARLYVYNRDMCRRLPLVFEEYTEAQGMPAYRFHMPPNVFHNPRFNPDNQCFCHSDDPNHCLPSGVFNSSACNFGAPLVMSFPHFLHGNDSLRHNVEGMSPSPEKHDMYVDIHPTLGLTLGGVSRLQVNVQVRKAPGVLGQTMSHFKDLSILPVAWFELKVTEFPAPLKNLLYHATFTVHILEMLLSYGFLAGGIASAAVLCRRLFLRERGTLDLSSDSPDSDSS